MRSNNLPRLEKKTPSRKQSELKVSITDYVHERPSEVKICRINNQYCRIKILLNRPCWYRCPNKTNHQRFPSLFFIMVIILREESRKPA